MKRTDFSDMDCSVARTLEVVGEWWTLLIIREATFGTCRFDDFQASLGIARNTLAARLARLVDRGILDRCQYQERPARYEYRLTEQGRELFPVVIAMWTWGDRWLTGPEGPASVLRHVYGKQVQAVMICAHCAAPIEAHEVSSEFPASAAGPCIAAPSAVPA